MACIRWCVLSHIIKTGGPSALAQKIGLLEKSCLVTQNQDQKEHQPCQYNGTERDPIRANTAPAETRSSSPYTIPSERS
ncbi:hypothetical protein N7534_003243 [Penicillium rubens]|nr:hypothetical protein N7534_003243 [Penicillium rubens]